MEVSLFCLLSSITSICIFTASTKKIWSLFNSSVLLLGFIANWSCELNILLIMLIVIDDLMIDSSIKVFDSHLKFLIKFIINY